MYVENNTAKRSRKTLTWKRNKKWVFVVVYSRNYHAWKAHVQ